jgi:hypothetical protein
MRRPTTMAEARASLQAKAEPKTPTLAAQWLAHAGRTLRHDAPAAEVRRAERAWYSDKFEELVKAPDTEQNRALMAECRGWARLYVGRRAA